MFTVCLGLLIRLFLVSGPCGRRRSGLKGEAWLEAEPESVVQPFPIRAQCGEDHSKYDTLSRRRSLTFKKVNFVVDKLCKIGTANDLQCHSSTRRVTSESNKTITDGGSTAPQNFCYQS